MHVKSLRLRAWFTLRDGRLTRPLLIITMYILRFTNRFFTVGGAVRRRASKPRSLLAILTAFFFTHNLLSNYQRKTFKY